MNRSCSLQVSCDHRTVGKSCFPLHCVLRWGEEIVTWAAMKPAPCNKHKHGGSKSCENSSGSQIWGVGTGFHPLLCFQRRRGQLTPGEGLGCGCGGRGGRIPVSTLWVPRNFHYFDFVHFFGNANIQTGPKLPDFY